MTIGVERPPKSAFQIRLLPAASGLMENLSGRLVSRDTPVCSGPRQAAQSAATQKPLAESAENAERKQSVRSRNKILGRKFLIVWFALLLLDFCPVLLDKSFCLHFKARQCAGFHGFDFGAKKQLCANRLIDTLYELGSECGPDRIQLDEYLLERA